jgi:hypothetical protein
VRRFSPGESIVWRSIDHDESVVQTVWPWTVVHDEPDRIVLYLPVGTVGKQRTGERGGPRGRLMVRWDGGHRDVTWHTCNVVRLYREGDDFSIWIARDDATGTVAWRYINLEAPWRRTAIGFDSKDHWLDLWSEPDSDDWHWKDEDELAWLVEQSLVDDAYAASVRASGERAVARIRSGDTLLHPSWSTWRPDGSWQIPLTPMSWKDLEPRG